MLAGGNSGRGEFDVMCCGAAEAGPTLICLNLAASSSSASEHEHHASRIKMFVLSFYGCSSTFYKTSTTRWDRGDLRT